MLASVGTEKRIMLSGIDHDQTSADFHNQNLGPVDAVLIASDLRLSTSLTTCNLTRNQFDGDSAFMLAKLGTEKRIMLSGIDHDQTSADFHNQNLGPVDAVLIESDLRLSASLTSINLSRNKLGLFSGQGVEVLTPAIRDSRSLTSVDLSYNNPIDGANSWPLNPREGIDFARALVDGGLFRGILTQINLAGNSIGMWWNSRFEESYGNQDTDNAIKEIADAIRGSRSLTEFNIRDLNIKDNNEIGLNAAQELTNVTMEKRIMLLLKHNQTEANFRDRKLNMQDFVLLANDIAVSRSLTQVDLEGGGAKICGFEHPFRGMYNGRPTYGGSLVSNDDMERPARGKTEFRTAGINAIAAALRVTSSLTELSLKECYILDTGTATVAQALEINTSLTKLNLHHCRVGVGGVTALAEALKKNTSLKTLNLYFNRLSGRWYQYAAQVRTGNHHHITTDKYIGDYYSWGITAFFHALKVNTSLTSLNLSMNYIGPEGGHALAQGLAANTALAELTMIECHVLEEGGSMIAQALAVNTTLTNLCLRSNYVGAATGLLFFQALEVNTSLTTLDLKDNYIGSECADNPECYNMYSPDRYQKCPIDCDTVYRAFAKIVDRNTSLTSLDLSKNRWPSQRRPLMEELEGLSKPWLKLVIKSPDVLGDLW